MEKMTARLVALIGLMVPRKSVHTSLKLQHFTATDWIGFFVINQQKVALNSELGKKIKQPFCVKSTLNSGSVVFALIVPNKVQKNQMPSVVNILVKFSPLVCSCSVKPQWFIEH